MVKKKYIYFISFVSALGGFLFGYDWVVIGGAKPFYEQFFGIADDPTMQGWAMSCALLGCLVGALLTGLFSDKYGRKKMLIGSSVLFIISAIGTGATSSFDLFIFYRILGGFAIGITSNLSPMYIAEVAPASSRGRLVSLNQLTIVLGILLAQITNMLIAQPVVEGTSSTELLASWNGQMGWRWMFWAENIPALLFFILLFFIPESPRWLAVNGRIDQAKNVLKNYLSPAQIEEELVAIQQPNRDDSAEKGGIFSKNLNHILLIGIVLAVFQQWCGINVIFNYAQEIFAAAGYGVSDMLMNIVITGVTNLIFTFVALFTVDKWGRRALLLMGSIGLCLIYLFMAGCYYFEIQGMLLLIVVVLAIACYAMSLAPVMWVVISEIFPNRIRGVAMGVTTFALWAASFILTYTFPILNSQLGATGTFLIYSFICLLGFVFIKSQVPETKGKTLEQIEDELVNTKNKTIVPSENMDTIIG